VEQLLEVEEEKKEVSTAGGLVTEFPANLYLHFYLGLLHRECSQGTRWPWGWRASDSRPSRYTLEAISSRQRVYSPWHNCVTRQLSAVVVAGHAFQLL
jgi:hypothetical protein